MRMRAAIALAVALVALGCHHDKYGLSVPKTEEYHLPPDQERFNKPDTATYRPKPPDKQQDTLLNRNQGSIGPGGKLGGF